MLSLIWEKRSIPLYWLLLDKKGSSSICEQKALIIPVLELLSDYKIIILGDREFGSIKLTDWLCEKKLKFIFRVKQGRYIQEKKSDYILLSDLGYCQEKAFICLLQKLPNNKDLELLILLIIGVVNLAENRMMLRWLVSFD
jgi:hypothetical protein